MAKNEMKTTDPTTKGKFKYLARLLKITLFAAAFLVFMTLTAVGSFVLWVKQSPRSISFLNSYISDGLRNIDPDLSTTIKDTILSWDSDRSLLVLKIIDIKGSLREEKDLVIIPEINAELDLYRLLVPRYSYLSLEIKDPVISFPAKKDIKDSDVKLDNTAKLNFNNILAEISEFVIANAKSPFYNVNITNAKLNFADAVTKTFYIDSVKLETNDVDGKVVITSNLNAKTDAYPVSFGMKTTIETSSAIHTIANIENFPSFLPLSFADKNSLPKALRDRRNYFLASGSADFLLKNKAVDNFNIKLDKFTGQYVTSNKSGKLIAFTTQNFAVNYKKDDNKILLNDAVIKISNQVNVKFDGDVNLKAEALNLDFSVENLSVGLLKEIWPDELLPGVKSWINESILEGNVSTMTGKLKLSEDSIVNGALKQDAISAKASVNNVKIQYSKFLPTVSNIKADLQFYGDRLEVVGQEAAVLGNRVKRANVLVPFTENADLKIDAEVYGDPKDVYNFIPDEVLKSLAEAGIHLNLLQGYAQTKLKISFPLAERELRFEDFKFDVTSKASNIRLPRIIEKYELTNGEINAVFNGKTVTLQGDGKLNQAAAKIDWLVNLGNVKPLSKGKIALNLKAGDDAHLDISDILRVTHGSAPVNLDISVFDGYADVDIASNMQNAEILFPLVGYTKANGNKADLSAKLRVNKNNVDVSKIDFRGQDILVNGSLVANNKFTEITQAKFNKIKFGRNDFAASISTANKLLKANITGEAIDYASFKKTGKSEHSPEEYDVTLNANKLYMKNNVIFTNVNGRLHCQTKRCFHADLSATMNSREKITLTSAPFQSNLQLTLHATDASLVSNALDIYTDIHGGKLEASGLLVSDSNGLEVANGTAIVTDFRATKTPIIAKILTLTSFSGLTDLLQGKEFTFEKFSADFNYLDKIINIANGKGKSSSVSFTIEGNVDTIKEYVNLKGTIIPAVMGVNKVIGEIPLIGKGLFQKENTGFIAFDYKVKGPYGKVDAYVNPLSVLKPGILRDLF